MAPNSDSVVPVAGKPVSSRGRLIALLAAVFYGLFTLVPDSSSLVLAWPWVFLWQVGFVCPVLWLLAMLWQGTGRSLHNRLDWLVLVLVLGLVVSSLFAKFPMQARWSSWAVLCALAALYALSSWVTSEGRRRGVLLAQTYLGLAFIGVSLWLWISGTLLPELNRLHALRQQYGVSLPFSFAALELRNWAPLGHQNAVAGYLALLLPLLIAGATVQAGRQRWLWWGGVGLGFLDLYTTGSRAPLLGFAVLGVLGGGVAISQGWISRRGAAIAGLGILGLLALVVVMNNRLRDVVVNLFTQQSGGGDLTYRVITNAVGWQMGSRHPWTGIGLGGVPLQYQGYRPVWAGREAELTQQLHSTPAQLWAELGIWAVVVGLGAIALLTALSWRWLQTCDPKAKPLDRLLLGSLGGLVTYGVVSLTDYQLDIVAIAGTLIVYLAVIIATFRDQAPQPTVPRIEAAVEGVPSRSQRDTFPVDYYQWVVRRWQSQPALLPLAGLGLLMAVLLWLIPIHRAWMLSNQGFLALRQDDFNGFAQRLEQATQLAPWEPYYPYQLGWNLSDRSLSTQDPALQLRLLDDGIAWFRQGNQISPDQEFGHTNLGWLLVNQNPQAASQEFGRSARLMPAKRGLFYGLGVSLLLQGKKDWATEALALEALRDPTFITSPLWQLKELQPLLKPVLDRMETQYSAGVRQQPQLALWHQLRGGLRWWRGDLAGAEADLAEFGDPASRMVLAVAAGKSVQAEWAQLPNSPGKWAIAAWLDPAKRRDSLRTAWIWAQRTDPPAIVLQQLEEAMGRSTSLDQWLKQNAPSRSYRRERSGFGVISRHIDGPIPVDFLKVVENIPVTQFFDRLIPRSLDFVPELDNALQPQREALLAKVLHQSTGG